MNPYIIEILKGAIIGFFLVLLVLVLFGCASTRQAEMGEFAQLAYFEGCVSQVNSPIGRIICDARSQVFLNNLKKDLTK